MIGFYDPYLYNSPPGKLNIPNLELMKASAYYTQEERQFCRLLLPNETSTENYDKIFCYSEFPVEVPDFLRRSSVVEYGGAGFTGGEYRPFENSLIDFTLPNAAIYKEFLRGCGRSPRVINDFLDDTYCRLYAGGEKLPIPKVNKKCRLYLFDKDIFYDGWETLFNSLNKRHTSGIYCVHPVRCQSLSQFFLLRSFSRFSRDNVIILDLKVPKTDLNRFFREYTNKFLAEITSCSKVYLPVGGTQYTNSEYYKNFIYVMNLLYGFWAHGIPMKVMYEPPEFGKINPIENLCDMVEKWTQLNSSAKKATPIKERMHKKNDICRDEMDLLVRNFPQAQCLFSQSWDMLNFKKYWGGV